MFIRPEEILMELSRTFKMKTFGLADVVEWCMQVEIDYIGDVDIMHKYEVETTVTNGRVQLPINIYRIISILDSDGKIINNKAIGGLYIHGLTDYEGEIITITFLGIPMDYDCMPLIAASHKDACKRYIILQMYEEEALMDVSMFKMQQIRWGEFSGVVMRTKQSFRDWTVDAIASLSLHRYNEPFKDVLRRIAERAGDNVLYGQNMSVSGYNTPSVGNRTATSRPNTINVTNDTEQNIRDVMDQYIQLINQRINELPYTISKTFVLGQDGTFISNTWTITLDGTLGVDTFEGSAVTAYMNSSMIIVPITCTTTTIIIDLSGVYDALNTYTISVVPPSNS